MSHHFSRPLSFGCYHVSKEMGATPPWKGWWWWLLTKASSEWAGNCLPTQ